MSEDFSSENEQKMGTKWKTRRSIEKGWGGSCIEWKAVGELNGRFAPGNGREISQGGREEREE
jgi:hypothetical protein